MFELPVWQISTTVRSGPGQWLAEAVATFGLLLTIFGCVARAPAASAVRGRALHHRGLLVHGLDLVRQSGRHDRAILSRHLRRHRAKRRPGVRRGATAGHVCSDCSRPPALARPGGMTTPKNPDTLSQTLREDGHELRAPSWNFTPHAADAFGGRGARRLSIGVLGAPYVARAQALKPVKLTIQFFARGDYAHVYLARERGYYKEQGLDVTFQHVLGNALALQALTAGNADLIHADLVQMLQLQGKTPDRACARSGLISDKLRAVAVLPEGQGHRQAEGPGRPQHRRLARLDGAVHLQPVRQGERHRHQQGAVEERGGHREGGDDAAEPGRLGRDLSAGQARHRVQAAGRPGDQQLHVRRHRSASTATG